jgi:HSP20 family molecular chaperone IbpA
MAETVKDTSKKNRKVYAPAVDIFETANNILVIADMPGVDEKSVDITIEKNLLTIHGMIDSTIHDNLESAFTEYGVGDYHRAFSLSDEIDRSNIKASVKDGVLKLVLPKSETIKTRKIEVIKEV